MPAPQPGSEDSSRPPLGEPAALEVSRTCLTAIDGRRAARLLAGWAKRFGLNESEFQVLWCLSPDAAGRLDQATLADRLALSPAQVSTTVERLRGRGWIVRHAAPGDRRRHLWQPTPAGDELLASMFSEISRLDRQKILGAASPPGPESRDAA